ncbi:hypothetical protein BABINDRAFT_7487 [Babjeviella inositovora NRRL Y-12698]|uniref:Golgi SNAP receptor complex member 1 n=1 Tax=Babjeviella inositovora NRRL Y-12698 TaxID=984486 RepID=A0A1E3QUU5_9ASCO|nr:uncharacterized protein BABINDRAFT_7487 [Babjeviella inositovora NRRL Y-12698]ODQ80802.1 hypothetical protein BABINDRAFT_7487 [Babjeviella inositovora NRRL Y-12698]
MSSTFPQTRAQAVALEQQTDTALLSYASFAQSTSSSATAEELSLERQVDTLLHKRDEIIGILTRTLESDKTLPASKVSQLARHKELLTNHWRDFGRIRGSIQQERNRMNLLFSVRSDIEAHQKRTESHNDTHLDEDQYMMGESRRVGDANGVADRLLAQAYETREELWRQRGVLGSASSRLGGVISTIPGINVVVKKINTRRKRDAAILSGLITLCILLLWFTT